jgi:hypothetical protein
MCENSRHSRAVEVRSRKEEGGRIKNPGKRIPETGKTLNAFGEVVPFLCWVPAFLLSLAVVHYFLGY